MPPETPVFIYHGDVVAFGARLDRPRRREVRGTVALTRVGGQASVREDALNLDGRVRFKYASSAASGDSYMADGNETHETRTTCTLEGLEFAGVVRADFVSATLVSTFTNDQHRFVEETVSMRGLWVNGRDRGLERRTPHIPKEPCGLEDIKRHAQNHGHLASRLEDLHTRPDGSPSSHCGKLVQTSNGHLACYLLEPSYIAFDRNGIRYELFLGEYLIYDQQRRLTMLRIESHPLPETKAARSLKRAVGGAPAEEDGDDGDDDSEDLEGSTTIAELAINGHKHP